MHKKLLASALLAACLQNSIYAQTVKNEKFELLARDIINTNKNIVIASGDVVVYSPTYYITADKAKYNKSKEVFELFGNVLIIKDNKVQTQSKYAYVNLQNKKTIANPNFLSEMGSNFWINSKKTIKNNNTVNFKDSILSSCDCSKPVWSIKTSSGDYDTKDKWLNAYNARFYLKDIPVFYFPYIGFSTDKTRRTGLLPPLIGYSKSEGFFYSQSLFIANAPDYDFEIRPQYRSRRGNGIYGYFRYADSPYSKLELKTGYFKEKNNYVKENKLKSDNHYGWEAKYERSKLFSNEKSQDGLYALIKYLNDVEFYTLEDNEDESSINEKVESKINYFYNTSKFYGGIYARYYINTAQDNNDETLQELPQFHAHMYPQRLPILRDITYSADAKVINYTRQKGLNARIYEANVPFSYNLDLIDDYLYFKAINKTTLSRYDYSNMQDLGTDFKDGTLMQNKTSLILGTDLLKPYENFLHTVNFNAKYNTPHNIKQNGDLYGITTDDDPLKKKLLNPFPVETDEKEFELSLSHSLYEKESLKQLINHKITQFIVYNNEENKYEFRNLENYIKVKYSLADFTQRLIYSFKDHQLTESDSSLGISYDDFKLTTGYYKSVKTETSGKDDSESYRINASYKISRDYKITYSEYYNIEEQIRSKQSFGININDRCWNLDLIFARKLEPATTTNNLPVDQKIVYFTLTFKPIGAIKQKYKRDKEFN